MRPFPGLAESSWSACWKIVWDTDTKGLRQGAQCDPILVNYATLAVGPKELP